MNDFTVTYTFKGTNRHVCLSETLISADFISPVAVRSSCVKVRLFSFRAIHYALVPFIKWVSIVSTNRRVFAGKTRQTQIRETYYSSVSLRLFVETCFTGASSDIKKSINSSRL